MVLTRKREKKTPNSEFPVLNVPKDQVQNLTKTSTRKRRSNCKPIVNETDQQTDSGIIDVCEDNKTNERNSESRFSDSDDNVNPEKESVKRTARNAKRSKPSPEIKQDAIAAPRSKKQTVSSKNGETSHEIQELNIPVNEKPESNDVVLSEYSSEDEGSAKSKTTVMTNKRKKTDCVTIKANNAKDIGNPESTTAKGTGISGRPSRIKKQIKYVESDSDTESNKRNVKRKSKEQKEDWDLPKSSSDSSDSNFEIDEPDFKDPDTSKHRKPSKASPKPVKTNASKPTGKSVCRNLTTRKKKEAIPISLLPNDPESKERLKKRGFDEAMKYFFGTKKVDSITIVPELVKKKQLKNMATNENSIPSTSSISSAKSSLKDKGSDDSSSESEWEEVSDAEQPMNIDDYHPEIPKEGVEINITIGNPRRDRFKKREKEFANYARQFLNRFKKDTQISMHKVHLLSYIAHMIHLNKILMDDLLQGLILSLLPNEFLGITTKKTTSMLLTKMVTWFRGTFVLEHSERELNLLDSLAESAQTKIVTRADHYCYLFVICGRVMKLDVRLCKSVYPISFKAADLIPTERQKTKKDGDAEKKPKSRSSKEKKIDGDEKTSLTKLKSPTTKTKSQKAKRSSSVSKSKQSSNDSKASSSKEGDRSKRRKKKVSYNEDEDESVASEEGDDDFKPDTRAVSESEDDEDDFEPEKPVRKRSSTGSSSSKKKKNRKILSSDSEEESTEGRACTDNWAEVYLNSEGKWVCVDVVQNIVNDPYTIESNASRRVSYVLSVDNESKIKDVTQRYASQWLTHVVKKLRVDQKWWHESLEFFAPPHVKREEAEDKQLDAMLMDKPMPTTIGEFKNHPLYVLKRHLLKYEGLYPPDCPPLGYIRKEPVYARECVRMLYSRETWKRQGRAIKLGEDPYKLVKARPRWDKVHKKIYTPEDPLDVYGEWQTETWVSPPCVDGKVPRNEYGNVELFQPSMLPAGAVHLRLPGLNRIARKLGLDCAPAMVGFDGSSAGIIPLFDGFVVCKEHKEIMLAAWDEEQVNIAKREQEKREKRIYGNWRKLIRGLLIREKIKSRYFTDDRAFTEEEGVQDSD